MHPKTHAAATPDKAAIVDAGNGKVTTYDALDRASNQVAQCLRAQALVTGDRIAILAGNTPGYFALVWGAQRAGLVFVCLSTRLTVAEADYILADSGARLLIAAAPLATLAAALTTPLRRFAAGGAIDGYDDWDAVVRAMPDTPIADGRAGVDMLYSSGTTGRPKGVRVALPEDPGLSVATPLVMIAAGFFGLGAHSRYLCPAPLYHAAPLRWSMTVHRLGGTVVLMDHFDAAAALAAIARYRCNAGQFVPTHFVRMLKLDQAVRDAHDVSSMQVAIHAAAPCPMPVKRAMIEWWGPVLNEYYAGTEGNGFTAIKAPEWLEHPGSVGRAIGAATLHIADDDGNALPPRTEGTVYFEGPQSFAYHNDPAKTAESRNRHGWTTLGDVGWVDEDGRLYLTDRRSFMIISGGVNVYPQEIENHLVTHPAVVDVAVVGAPHEDMGEQVVAVVQLADGETGSDALAAELVTFCRTQLSGVKVPRRIDFVAQLPRHDTGKLYKRLIREAYWRES